MEKNFAGMNRIIRILDEELTGQMSAGLCREAEKTRKRLETYIDMSAGWRLDFKVAMGRTYSALS